VYASAKLTKTTGRREQLAHEADHGADQTVGVIVSDLLERLACTSAFLLGVAKAAYRPQR